MIPIMTTMSPKVEVPSCDLAVEPEGSKPQSRSSRWYQLRRIARRLWLALIAVVERELQVGWYIALIQRIPLLIKLTRLGLILVLVLRSHASGHSTRIIRDDRHVIPPVTVTACSNNIPLVTVLAGATTASVNHGGEEQASHCTQWPQAEAVRPSRIGNDLKSKLIEAAVLADPIALTDRLDSWKTECEGIASEIFGIHPLSISQYQIEEYNLRVQGFVVTHCDTKMSKLMAGTARDVLGQRLTQMNAERCHQARREISHAAQKVADLQKQVEQNEQRCRVIQAKVDVIRFASESYLIKQKEKKSIHRQEFKHRGGGISFDSGRLGGDATSSLSLAA